MATKFQQEASSQLEPVYQQSEQAISSQVPAVQKLYDTLISGLQGQYDTQLATGTQGIVEDASARGVLRSTLPVDARQALTGQLSQALLQGRGQLESQRAGDIAGINEKLGSLRIQKTGAIADLARALETQDLQAQELALKKLDSERSYQLARQKASSGGGSESTPQWQFNQQALQTVAGKWKPGGDGFVNPGQWNAMRRDWTRAGFNVNDFDSQFASLINPAHFKYKELPQYSVNAGLKKQF